MTEELDPAQVAQFVASPGERREQPLRRDDPGEIMARIAELNRLIDAQPPYPHRISVSDRATLDAFTAHLPGPEPGTVPDPAASLLSVPIVTDPGMPPGRVRVIDQHGGLMRELWHLGGGRWISTPITGWPPVTGF